jgi:hypothetical protein
MKFTLFTFVGHPCDPQGHSAHFLWLISICHLHAP